MPDGYWAEDAIAWAYENGCMNGNTAVTFNPNGTVSRQQLWMILARLSGYNPAAMAEAKSWAVDNGIVGGTTQGTLNPAGTATRAQFAVILSRFCENIAG